MKRSLKTHTSNLKMRHQTGSSLVIVIIYVGVLSAVVLPMARTTVLEEKISQSHDWLNIAYADTLGEVSNHSDPESLDLSQCGDAISQQTKVVPTASSNHSNTMEYRGANGIPYGFSSDRFKGFQLDVVAEANYQTTGSFNEQVVGLVCISKSS